jgi:phosphoserine phosphatase RsbU/P
MRILIAEDDLTSRILLGAVLKKAGHEVVQAVDGFEALEILKGPDAPRLAILDWMMPRMDGLDIVRALRAEQSNNPPYLIMLTTKTEKADIIEGLNAGANDYLSKPFDPGELRARIEVGRRMTELQDTLTNNLAELRDALDHVKTLRGIVPICASCKKIRDDQGYWQQVEAYVREHTDAQFSHGICPECAAKLYPDFYKARERHDDVPRPDTPGVSRGVPAQKGRTENEDTLRTLINATHESLVMVDRDGTVLLSNTTGAQRLGKTAEGLIGTCLYDHFPPAVARRRKNEVDRVVATGETVYFEDVRDGRDFELYCSPVFDDKRNVSRIVIFAHETTRRKRAEEEALAWKKRYDLVVSSSRQIVYDMTLDDKMVTFSGNLGEVLGYGTEEIESNYFEQWKNLIEPGDLQRVLGTINEAARTKERFQVEYGMRHKGGHYINVLDRGFFFHDDTTGKDSVMGTIQDITDRKKAENIVAKALEEKNSMFRELQHRIKNSLAIIAGLVSLEIGNHDNEETRTALMSVNDRIRSLGNLYQLLYQTGDSRKVRLDRYLEIIIESIVSSYLQDSERIKVLKDLDPIEIDVKIAAPLGLILNELLTNSLKHAFPGDMGGEVTIALSCCDPCVLLKVSDTGAGLPQGFSMENASGLGMQIVGLLTEQLEGNLDIARDAGTVFSLSIKMPGDRP